MGKKIVLVGKIRNIRVRRTEFNNNKNTNETENQLEDSMQANISIVETKLWCCRLSRVNQDDIPRKALKLLLILATLPVSTCISERSISNLRRLKLYLRNSTGETRLNGQALLNTDRAHTPTNDEVSKEFMNHKRRLDFALM